MRSKGEMFVCAIGEGWRERRDPLQFLIRIIILKISHDSSVNAPKFVMCAGQLCTSFKVNAQLRKFSHSLFFLKYIVGIFESHFVVWFLIQPVPEINNKE